MIEISPSILSCDFARLGQQVQQVLDAGADMVHVDVMDGVFVPNISIGIPVVQSLRRAVDGVLDVHLMITQPLRYIEAFAKAGADLITFHWEAGSDAGETIDAIHRAGKMAGLAIKPATPAQVVLPYLDQLEMVLVMTVEPGFGGQKFMADMCPKLEVIRDACLQRQKKMRLQVDGGISPQTAGCAARAGANVLVAGSAVFGREDYQAAMDEIRLAAAQAAQ